MGANSSLYIHHPIPAAKVWQHVLEVLHDVKGGDVAWERSAIPTAYASTTPGQGCGAFCILWAGDDGPLELDSEDVGRPVMLRLGMATSYAHPDPYGAHAHIMWGVGQRIIMDTGREDAVTWTNDDGPELRPLVDLAPLVPVGGVQG